MAFILLGAFQFADPLPQNLIILLQMDELEMQSVILFQRLLEFVGYCFDLSGLRLYFLGVVFLGLRNHRLLVAIRNHIDQRVQEGCSLWWEHCGQPQIVELLLDVEVLLFGVEVHLNNS